MILVTGATGTTGSEVVKQLLEQGEKVRAMTRKAIDIPGAEVVQADFGDASSLARAVDGVTAVYLVTAPPKPVIDHDVALVEAAKAAGVQRIVKLGAIGGDWHRRSEQPTRDSGLAWTILRPGTFASNMLAFAPRIKHGDPLPNWTKDGAIGVIDPRDIAAVAARVLTTDGHSGRAYTLTGPQLLTFAQQVAVLELVLGTRIAVESVPVDDAMDPETAAGMTDLAEGRYAVLTDHVAEILGRAPISFTTWANDHQAAFG
jgi:uncharacterized protein YbjT (DUF2867 family)